MPNIPNGPFLDTVFDISDFLNSKMISAANLADKTDARYVKKLINTEIQILNK